MFSEKHESKIQLLLNHYESLFDMHNGADSYEVLDWESINAQMSRFSVLIENIDLSNKRILDAGCGLAHLYDFLKRLEIPFKYTGIDLSEKLIGFCREKYPEAEFRCTDIVTCDECLEGNSFDIIYSSGVFNLNLGYNMDLLKKCIPVFYNISSKYVVFNLLIDTSNDKDERYFYFSPEYVIGLLRQYPFKNIKIVEDYLQNDFSIICLK